MKQNSTCLTFGVTWRLNYCVAEAQSFFLFCHELVLLSEPLCSHRWVFKSCILHYRILKFPISALILKPGLNQWRKATWMQQGVPFSCTHPVSADFIYSQVHKYLKSDTINNFASTTTKDLKLTHQNVTEVEIFGFNSKGFTKILH